MNTLTLLGTGLLKKDKKIKGQMSSEEKLSRAKENARRLKRSASVELFLREILGTHLIQIEKKF